MATWLEAFVKSALVIGMVLQMSAFLLWIERKGSALIQDRIGANRASFFGVMPINLGLLNTLVADPVKLFTKEDFVPSGADKLMQGKLKDQFAESFPKTAIDNIRWYPAVPAGLEEIEGKVLDRLKAGS